MDNKRDTICGINRCKETKESWHLCCQKHWALLPETMRDRIWKEYKKRKGSEEHRQACFDCVKWLLDNENQATP